MNSVPEGDSVALLGIDWGTSNLRVHLINMHGRIVQSRRSAQGILNVPTNGFAAVLQEQAGEWLREWPAVPVVACGMVGARQGWVEVPYLQCPIGSDDLARALVPVALACGRTLHLVGGVSWRDGVDLADVIRGEETTIIGVLGDAADVGDALFCLPGTHTKWAWVADGAVQRFRTTMSGEVYQLLLEHSILGRMAASGAPFDRLAFLRGVDRAGTQGGLLHHLFSVRSLRLFEDLTEEQAPSYLSGLLTGADVLAMRDAGELAGPLTLLGEGASAQAYEQALSALDVSYTLADGDDAVAMGLFAIAHRAALL